MSIKLYIIVLYFIEYVQVRGFACQPLLGNYSSFFKVIADCSRNLQCSGVVQRWGNAKKFNFCEYSAKTVESHGGSNLYRKSKQFIYIYIYIYIYILLTSVINISGVIYIFLFHDRQCCEKRRRIL